MVVGAEGQGARTTSWPLAVNVDCQTMHGSVDGLSCTASSNSDTPCAPPMGWVPPIVAVE